MGIFGHGISLHDAHPHVCRIAPIQWGRGICGLTHGGLVIISTRVVICRGVPTLMVREIGLMILSLILGVILGLPRGGARILWKNLGRAWGITRGVILGEKLRMASWVLTIWGYELGITLWLSISVILKEKWGMARCIPKIGQWNLR